MSQHWKQMNKSGKFCFIFGSVFALLGLQIVISNNIIWIGSLVVGLHYITWAGYDDRFNIKYVKEVKS